MLCIVYIVNIYLISPSLFIISLLVSIVILSNERVTNYFIKYKIYYIQYNRYIAFWMKRRIGCNVTWSFKFKQNVIHVMMCFDFLSFSSSLEKSEFYLIFLWFFDFWFWNILEHTWIGVNFGIANIYRCGILMFGREVWVKFYFLFLFHFFNNLISKDLFDSVQ